MNAKSINIPIPIANVNAVFQSLQQAIIENASVQVLAAIIQSPLENFKNIIS